MKGKAATQNANRRTAEAVERADRLAEQLAAEKRLRSAEVQDLSDELRKLRAAIDQKAQQRAAAAVQAAQTAAADALADERGHFSARAEKAVRVLWYADPVIHPHPIEQVAQILGVNTAPLVAGDVGLDKAGRAVRRRVERRTLADQAGLDAEMENDPLQRAAERAYRLNNTEVVDDGAR